MTETLQAHALRDFHFLKLGEKTLNDPYPFFARLRKEAPVFEEPDYGVFLVSRFDDIATVSRRTDVFSSIAVASGPFVPLPFNVDKIAQYRADTPELEKLFHNDPPDHSRYRSLVSTLFTPRRLARVEEEICGYIDGLIDAFIDEGRVEFIQAFSHVLPLLVVGSLLGVPKKDNAKFKKLFEDAFAHMDEYFFGNPDGPRVEVPHYAVLREYFTGELVSRRENPTDGLLSDLANARFPDGSEVPLADLVGICVFLYSAGGDSNMPQTLTNGMKFLAQHPDVAQQLRDDPKLIDKFVSESMRYETSALGLFRLALEDVEIGGVTIPKGRFAMILFGSGNHDENYFEKPEEFRLDRPTSRILSFGTGAHTCAGQPLARLQAKLAFTRLTERLSDIKLASSEQSFSYLPSCILRSVRELNLEFTKA